jgi:hypothetical protein
MRNAYKILVGTPETNRPIARHTLDGKKILQWKLRKYCRIKGEDWNHLAKHSVQ